MFKVRVVLHVLASFELVNLKSRCCHYNNVSRKKVESCKCSVSLSNVFSLDKLVVAFKDLVFFVGCQICYFCFMLFKCIKDRLEDKPVSLVFVIEYIFVCRCILCSFVSSHKEFKLHPCSSCKKVKGCSCPNENREEHASCSRVNIK